MNIKEDKKKFNLDEEQLKRLINSQKRQENFIRVQTQKIVEAETFAKAIGVNNEGLKKKLFENALREFREEEFNQIKNR